MAITAQRYQEIDTALHQMRDYLLALSLEIDPAPTEQHPPSFHRAGIAAARIEQLRQCLQRDPAVSTWRCV
jgi:hypothetical protein